MSAVLLLEQQMKEMRAKALADLNREFFSDITRSVVIVRPVPRYTRAWYRLCSYSTTLMKALRGVELIEPYEADW